MEVIHVSSSAHLVHLFIGHLDTLIAQLVKNPLPCGRCGFEPQVGKILEKGMHPSTPVYLPGESLARGAW